MADLSNISTEQLVAEKQRRLSLRSSDASTANQQSVPEPTPAGKLFGRVGSALMKTQDSISLFPKTPTHFPQIPGFPGERGFLESIPDKYVEPALSAGGFAIGSEIPIPFASTALSAFGSAIGQAETARRQISSGQKPNPFSPIKSFVERPAESLVVGGLGKVAKAVPFMTKYGTKVFGKTLQSVDKVIPLKDVRNRIIMAMADKGSAISNAITQARVNYGNKFGVDIIGDVLKNETGNVSVQEAQHLANALEQSPTTKSFSQLIRRKIVTVAPEIKELYGNFGRAQAIKSGAKTAARVGGRATTYYGAYRLFRGAEKAITSSGEGSN